MAFPQSIPSNWVVRKVASTSTHLSDLKPFEFGIFDEDTHNSLSLADVAKRRNVYFAVGNPNTRQFTQGSKVERLGNQNNSDVTYRTEVFPTKQLDLVRAQTPVTDEKQNVYYLGYNGIDVCNTLKFECGQTYTFQVQVRGRAVRQIFMHEMRELIEFTTDCCDDCTQTDCSVGEDCHKYIDALVERFNTGLWVSRFFKAEKVINCGTPLAALDETAFVKYCLTVCDNGDEIALSNVQLQYPTYDVKRIERSAPYSTYQVIKTAGLPTAFSQSSVVLTECGDCPSGFTEVAGGFASLVEIDNANPADALAAVQAVWATATSASLVRFENGTSQYYVVSSTLLANPAAGVDAAVIYQLGTVPDTCTSGATTTAWIACGTAYKVTRDLCITIGNDDCDAAEGVGFDGAEVLARLTATLANDPTYVRGSLALDADSTACVLRFTASQFNNDFLEDGCDTLAVAKFDDLLGFEGQRWVVCPCEGWTVNGDGCPVPPAADTNCCQCGIKFTGLPTEQLLDQFGGYDFATYLEKDPIELSVTVFRDDRETDICKIESPTWLHAQRATYRQLRGDDVIKQIILDRFYNQEPWVNQTDKTNQLFLQREGIKLGIDVSKFYYAITVYFNKEYRVNVNASHSDIRNAMTLYVSEDDLSVFTQLKQVLGTAFTEAKLENF